MPMVGPNVGTPVEVPEQVGPVDRVDASAAVAADPISAMAGSPDAAPGSPEVTYATPCWCYWPKSRCTDTASSAR